ncbi:MAG TPA: amidase [Balneolaceae bacterium]|nr:amidase [Balneolaceae bacterium]
MKKRTFYLLLGLSLGFLLCFTSIYLVNRKITTETITKASTLLGINFTPAEKDSMITGLKRNRKRYEILDSLDLKNSVPPALVFNPVPPGKKFNHKQEKIHWNIPDTVSMPKDRNKLAYYSIKQLASLIKQRKISCVALTKFFLNRLNTYGDTLHAVITMTRKRALRQARKMDKELANGHYRGPLMGIPYTVKDLFAVKGYKTTWGAAPYKNQRINKTATVVKRLDKAGAILLAKSTPGALAMGDVWFGGMTRNPWNLKQGSSGSSAGPAATTSAGLVPFSIGTETLGSIVSPSSRTGDTGLRPTFGRVSRYGVMALSWSMDKVGPIARSAEGDAIVFNAIYGPDGHDQTVHNLPFNYKENINLDTVKIGYVKAAFNKKYYNHDRDSLTLAKLREMGAHLVPIKLPHYHARAMRIILNAEAADAFNHLTLSNRDSLLVRQSKNAWPNIFRTSRFIPAVEYIQANRAREILIQKMDSLMQKVDLYVSPALVGYNLLVTNLTGNPSVVVPNGFNKNGEPTSITFNGALYDEATVLEVAKKYQEATDFNNKHPKMFMK